MLLHSAATCLGTCLTGWGNAHSEKQTVKQTIEQTFEIVSDAAGDSVVSAGNGAETMRFRAARRGEKFDDHRVLGNRIGVEDLEEPGDKPHHVARLEAAQVAFHSLSRFQLGLTGFVDFSDSLFRGHHGGSFAVFLGVQGINFTGERSVSALVPVRCLRSGS